MGTSAARVNNRKELASRKTHESAAPAFRIVTEVDQRVAIVNLDVKEAQCGEAEKPGNLRTDAVAHRSKIERCHVLIFLLQMPELQDGLIGGEYLVDAPADAFHSRIGIPVDFGDFAGRSRRNEVR